MDELNDDEKQQLKESSKDIFVQIASETAMKMMEKQGILKKKMNSRNRVLLLN